MDYRIDVEIENRVEGGRYIQYRCVRNTTGRYPLVGDLSGLISECSVVEFDKGAWVDKDSRVFDSEIKGNSYVEHSVLTDCGLIDSITTGCTLHDTEVIDSTLFETHVLHKEEENDIYVQNSRLHDVILSPVVGISSSELTSCSLLDGSHARFSTISHLDVKGVTLNNVIFNGRDLKDFLGITSRVTVSSSRDFMCIINIGSEEGNLGVVYDRERKVVFLNRGCFFGTFKDFQNKLSRSHPEGTGWRKEYDTVLQLIKLRFNQEEIDWDVVLSSLKGELTYYVNGTLRRVRGE